MRYCSLKLRNKVKLNKEKQLLCQYAANCLSCERIITGPLWLILIRWAGIITFCQELSTYQEGEKSAGQVSTQRPRPRLPYLDQVKRHKE